MAQEDPVLRSARREMIVTFVIFLCALTYTITYSYQNGYNRDPQSLTFVLGFPDWIFYGVIAPWAVCVGLSWVISSVFFRDEDLGQEREDPADA
jgi:hypothetical protein